MSGYNPFSPYGQYAFKSYLYENKTGILAFASLCLLIVLCLLVNAWDTIPNPKSKTGSKFYTPPPILADGPYGIGEYLPPKHILLNSIS